MKGVCFRVNEWVFCLLSYIGLALDRTMVQGSTLVCLESDMEAIDWV